MELLWALVAVAFVSLLSLIGALGLLIPGVASHRFLMFLVAGAAGTLIGDSFLHLLPEATAEAQGFSSTLGLTVVAGFLVMFLLEGVLHWRHSHTEHADAVHHPEHQVQAFGWMNLAGDALHNFLDGIIIGAAFLLDPMIGLATTIAVAAHEIPQELGDFAVLLRSGMVPKKALLLNLASAAFAFLGVALVFIMPWSDEALKIWALPLIAGAFIYIAAADLIPELHHHSKGKDMLIILAGLLLGLLAMWLLLDLESVLPLGDDGHNH